MECTFTRQGFSFQLVLQLVLGQSFPCKETFVFQTEWLSCWWSFPPLRVLVFRAQKTCTFLHGWRHRMQVKQREILRTDSHLRSLFRSENRLSPHEGRSPRCTHPEKHPKPFSGVSYQTALLKLESETLLCHEMLSNVLQQCICLCLQSVLFALEASQSLPSDWVQHAKGPFSIETCSFEILGSLADNPRS